MASITIYSHEANKYYITLELQNNIYKVQVLPCIDENLCGYPIRSITYPYTKKEKAMTTYKRYIREFTK